MHFVVWDRYDRGHNNGYDRGRSPDKGLGHRGSNRSRSRSLERFDKALPTGGGSAGWSFHKAMMERERSSPPPPRSLPYGGGVDEAEEGMIPQEEEGGYHIANA